MGWDTVGRNRTCWRDRAVPPAGWAGAIKTSTMCHAVDVWSFGCMMAEIFNGKPLMGVGETNAHICAAVVAWSTAWTWKQPSRQLFLIPAHLRCLLWWCCAPEPGRRPRIRGDVRALAMSLVAVSHGSVRPRNFCWRDLQCKPGEPEGVHMRRVGPVVSRIPLVFVQRVAQQKVDVSCVAQSSFMKFVISCVSCTALAVCT